MAVGMMVSTPSIAQTFKFYYYPTQNVYYDLAGSQYIYYNGSTWVRVSTLPAYIRVVPASRVVVYHTGRNVWVGNAAHVKKYKGKNYKPARSYRGKPGKGKKS